MNIEKCIKETFSVIGKEGSTEDGPGFVQNLWADANSHFVEVAHLAKKDESGNLAGIWGAMSDFSHSFHPWEDDFTKGLYLAGVECWDDAQPPEGWTKWVIPGFEYLQVECESKEGRCYGLLADEHFLLVSEYGENAADPEVVVYVRR